MSHDSYRCYSQVVAYNVIHEVAPLYTDCTQQLTVISSSYLPFTIQHHSQ